MMASFTILYSKHGGPHRRSQTIWTALGMPDEPGVLCQEFSPALLIVELMSVSVSIPCAVALYFSQIVWEMDANVLATTQVC